MRTFPFSRRTGFADVHQRKTAELFLAPLFLPFELEPPRDDVIDSARGALQNFALGCQVIDDVKDMYVDVHTHRHNLLISLLARDHGDDAVHDLRRKKDDAWVAWEQFPAVSHEAFDLSRSYFQRSFRYMDSLGIAIPERQHQTVMQLICRLLQVPIPRQDSSCFTLHSYLSIAP